MMMLLTKGVLAAFVLFCITGCNEHAIHKDKNDVHALTKEDAHEHGEHDKHAGETPDAHGHESGDAHESGEEIGLTPEMIQMAGIKTGKLSMGRIRKTVNLSGEIGFNEEALVHITPRFAGIVREASRRVGDNVEAQSIVATIESNESMNHYSLKTPISGRVIEKHAAVGEYVSETESMYIIADLSTVWVNLAVYPKDAALVKTGQYVRITQVGSDISAEGTIRYVTPVVDPQTRRITARVELPNVNGQWRPGTFVNASVDAGISKEIPVVEKDAVQILNDKPVIFISDEVNFFRPVGVSTGESDSFYVHITGGVEAGVEYVKQGAFELKAKIITSSLGGHAGHGH